MTQLDLQISNYPQIRTAFNQALHACVAKLTKTDYRFAHDALELEFGMATQQDPVVADTALFSGQPNGKRAIERITPKLAKSSRALDSNLLARLPSAFFSVFEMVSSDADGIVIVKDVLDQNRQLKLLDVSIASTGRPGLLFTARIVDLGPWHIGFGIVMVLSKSEAVAIALACQDEDETVTHRDELHELVYVCKIHHEDLVMTALTPVIDAIATSLDESDIDIASVLAVFRMPLSVGD